VDRAGDQRAGRAGRGAVVGRHRRDRRRDRDRAVDPRRRPRCRRRGERCRRPGRPLRGRGADRRARRWRLRRRGAGLSRPAGGAAWLAEQAVIPLLLLIAIAGLMQAARSFTTAAGASATELAFGFLLLTAYFMARLVSRIGLPRLTGYLAAGVLAGPFV